MVLGIWLLSSTVSAIARIGAFGTFTAFAIVSGWLGSIGQSSCKCFGYVEINSRRYSSVIMAKVCGFMAVGCASLSVMYSTATPVQAAFAWDCPSGPQFQCATHTCRFGAYICTQHSLYNPYTGLYDAWCTC